MPNGKHPETSPSLTKADYIRNAVFASVRVQLALYLAEGATLPETALLTQRLQEVVHRAYHAAVSEAATDVTGTPPAAPGWGEGLSDDNPFNPMGEPNEQ